MNTPEIQVRPRTLGELLDDAWHLYLANVTPLLMITGLLFVPCVALFLLILVLPPQSMWAWILVPTAALLFPLTGITSGACQELFHCWGEKEPVSLRKCFRIACSRGVNHVTAQALMLILPITALMVGISYHWVMGILVFLFCIPHWIIAMAWQAVLTGGQKHLVRAYRFSRKCAADQPWKAMIIVFARVALLAVAILNLHLFATWTLWFLDQSAGIEIGFLGLIFRLNNPAYLLVLGSLAWWLLSPYTEAVNYFYYVDARTRFEGLDLWYRIEKNFPIPKETGKAVLMVLLSFGASGPMTGKLEAANRAEVISKARQAVHSIQEQMKSADPYPGGNQYKGKLRKIATSLDPESNSDQGRYRWFHQLVDDVGIRNQEKDLDLVKQLDNRLKVIEASLKRPPRTPSEENQITSDEIRNLIPPREETRKQVKPKEKEKEEEIIEEFEDQPNFQGGGPKASSGIMSPVAVGGNFLTWLLITVGVILLALIGYTLFLAFNNWSPKKPKKSKEQGKISPHEEEYLENPDQQNVQSLWQKADELAQAGRFLEALRSLYWGVLALLHQAHHIRYERTRTNGEYADQLRKQPLIHPIFLRLTGIFELKWYGERNCQEMDYANCRELATRIHQETSG